MPTIANRTYLAVGLVIAALEASGHAQAADDPMACVAEVQRPR